MFIKLYNFFYLTVDNDLNENFYKLNLKVSVSTSLVSKYEILCKKKLLILTK